MMLLAKDEQQRNRPTVIDRTLDSVILKNTQIEYLQSSLDHYNYCEISPSLIHILGQVINSTNTRNNSTPIAKNH